MRVSDGAVLLTSTAITLLPFSHQNASTMQYQANVSFAFPPGDKIYGLGEHRTGQVAYTEYFHKYVLAGWINGTGMYMI